MRKYSYIERFFGSVCAGNKKTGITEIRNYLLEILPQNLGEEEKILIESRLVSLIHQQKIVESDLRKILQDIMLFEGLIKTINAEITIATITNEEVSSSSIHQSPKDPWKTGGRIH